MFNSVDWRPVIKRSLHWYSDEIRLRAIKATLPKHHAVLVFAAGVPFSGSGYTVWTDRLIEVVYPDKGRSARACSSISALMREFNMGQSVNQTVQQRDGFSIVRTVVAWPQVTPIARVNQYKYVPDRSAHYDKGSFLARRATWSVADAKQYTLDDLYIDVGALAYARSLYALI